MFLTLWVPRDLYIRHERLSPVPFWCIYVMNTVLSFRKKNIFHHPGCHADLVKKLKSTIYNIIMFINLLWWNLCKQFWKKLFIFKYIIYNLGFNYSQSECVYHETWSRVQSWMILTVFAIVNKILFEFCFSDRRHISFVVFLCSCWVVLLKRKWRPFKRSNSESAGIWCASSSISWMTSNLNSMNLEIFFSSSLQYVNNKGIK